MKLGLLFVGLISSSCGSLPKKPSIDLCSHDEPTGMVYCVNNQTDATTDLEIGATDKYIMMSPEHWGLTVLYIRELEKKAKGKVKSEIRKIINASVRLNKDRP